MKKQNLITFGWHCLYIVFFLLVATAPIHHMITTYDCVKPSGIGVFAYIYPPLVLLLSLIGLFKKGIWRANVFMYLFTDVDDPDDHIQEEEQWVHWLFWGVGILLPITILGFVAEDCVRGLPGPISQYYWAIVSVVCGASWIVTTVLLKRHDPHRPFAGIFGFFVAILGWWVTSCLIDFLEILIYFPDIFTGYFTN